MAEKINIAEINIDTKSLLSETAKIKKELDDLKKQQKELQKEGETSSKQYVQNAADIKSLTSAYNTNTKALAKNTKAVKDQETAQERLDAVMNQEIKTIQQARDQNKLLNQLRNNTNATTEEGRKQIEQLNAKLDENNAFIEENADGYLKLKLRIGDYAGGIKSAFKDLNIFNGGLVGFISRSKEAGGSSKLLTNSLKTITKSIIGLTKATLAFLATPIGLFVGAIALAFGLVSNAINRSEESANSLTKAFSTVSAFASKLLAFLKPLGDFIITGLTVGFEVLNSVIEATIGFFAAILDFLGFDETADSLRGVNEELKEVNKNAEKLANTEAKLTKELRRQGLVQLEFQKQAEKLRQLRDDESKSIEERIKANEDLGQVLQRQLEEELRIARLALEAVNLRIKVDGERSELLDKQADALLKIAEIEERITSQTSEQLTNRNALLKEQNDLIRERIQLSIKAQQDELELLKLQDEQFSESLEERIVLQQEYALEQQSILKRQLSNDLITRSEYNIEVQKIENDLNKLREELRQEDEQQQAEYEQRRLDLINSIREKQIEDELARQEFLNQVEFEKQKAEIEKLEIDEEQKSQLLRLLTYERELVLAAIRDEFRQEELEKIVDFNKEQIKLGSQVTKAEKQQAQARAAIAQNLTNTLKGLLGESIAAQLAGVAIDAAVQSGLLKIDAAQASGRITANVGVANAKAIAASPLTGGQPFVGINTAQGVALQTALATQTALAQAKIIQSAAIRGVSTITGGFRAEQGGVFGIDGKSHSEGGVPIYAGNKYIGEAEGGEGIGILSRPAFGAFMDFNNQYSNGKMNSFPAREGTIATNLSNASSVLSRDIARDQGITQDEILQIVSAMPNPVVGVEQIVTQTQRANEVQVMADI